MEHSWTDLERAVRGCTRCKLCGGRTNTVLGEGSREAAILCIGEGPGQQEDLQGRPFVGPAGRLLDKMLAAISLTREEVYIANVVKCRPPMNRSPEPDEIQNCLPFLRAQVGLIRPRILFLLGATAGRAVIGPDFRVTRDRGKWAERKGYHMLASFHPSALLRDQSGAWKRLAWEDLKSLRAKYDELKGEEA
ncbi:MAG: uracil-DNA glycosylase [Christensenellaceae bacterium]|jgi:DNA polymerase|nr:uracil-DNA glycosylase [Christensenellaceae bacterium]